MAPHERDRAAHRAPVSSESPRATAFEAHDHGEPLTQHRARIAQVPAAAAVNGRARIAHLHVHANGCVAGEEVQADDEIQQGLSPCPIAPSSRTTRRERSLLLDGHLPRGHLRLRSIVAVATSATSTSTSAADNSRDRAGTVDRRRQRRAQSPGVDRRLLADASR